jgi:hypothetical protein
MRRKERVLVERFKGLDEFGKEHDVTVYDIFDVDDGPDMDSRLFIEKIAQLSDGTNLAFVSDDIFRIQGQEWTITRRR